MPLSTCHLCPPQPAPPGGPSHWPQCHSGPLWLRWLNRASYAGLESLLAALTWNTLFCSLIFLYFSSSGCRWMLSRYLGQNRRIGTGLAWLPGSSVPPTPRRQLRATAGLAVSDSGVGAAIGPHTPGGARPWCRQPGSAQDAHGGPVPVPAPGSCLPWRAPVNHGVSGQSQSNGSP